ncbi:MAG: cyclopropane-fatty-acyl-phospholipid synthase family protein [Hyphomicrobiaceae bacterium]|nr:cyclopropane-fatty-acyl-phospholipid synthase family protein [Hyphomicrobiaceae bacterium]
MIQELTADGAARPRLIIRLLTPFIRGSGQRMLRWTPAGSILLELPNGQRLRFGAQSGAFEPLLKLNNYGVISKSLWRGGIGFAEAYIDGDFDCSDLTEVFRFFIRNRDRLDDTGGALFKARLPDRVAHLARRNTLRGSRRNISEHYDLGNDFYRLWLDGEMNYSSGLYEAGCTSLAHAQAAKIDLIRDALQLDGGEKVLEIGCGWGSLARHLAVRKDAVVTGLTLSWEQLDHACKMARVAGLANRCKFQLRDYRDENGLYDRIVSVEMIEAVGEENWPRYFRTLNERLRPGGSAVIQAITMEARRFEKYRRKADFIQRYIFPGGMLPTETAVATHAERNGFAFEPVERFGQSYALTLQEWRRRFENAWPQIEALGFDETFRRKWRYYLAYCEAGFLEGVIDVGVYRLRKI